MSTPLSDDLTRWVDVTPERPSQRRTRRTRSGFAAFFFTGLALTLAVGLLALDRCVRSEPWYTPIVTDLARFEPARIVGPQEPLPDDLEPFTEIEVVEHACYRLTAAPRATVCFFTFAAPPVPLPLTVNGQAAGPALFPSHAQDGLPVAFGARTIALFVTDDDARRLTSR